MKRGLRNLVLGAFVTTAANVAPYEISSTTYDMKSNETYAQNWRQKLRNDHYINRTRKTFGKIKNRLQQPANREFGNETASQIIGNIYNIPPHVVKKGVDWMDRNRSPIRPKRWRRK